MHIEELTAIVRNIRNHRNEVDGKLKAAEQELADALCPFKTGDRISSDSLKEIWEFCWCRLSYDDDSVNLFGKRVKKDGTPGKDVRQIWNWNKDIRLATVEDEARVFGAKK